MMKKLSPVLAASILLFGATAQAENLNTPYDWIARMATAMDQLSYQGTFVYAYGDHIETMRITHAVSDGKVRERLYSIDGTRREIVRDENGVRCILSDDGAGVEDAFVNRPMLSGIPLDKIGRENSSYKLALGKRSRIAGHIARALQIKPIDQYRYGYSLWLEENTGLLLKLVVRDVNGRSLSKLVFTDFTIGDAIDLAELQPAADSNEYVKLKRPIPSAQLVANQALDWRPQHVPPGFSLAAHSHQKDGEVRLFEHQIYSDGLAAVSIYVETASDPDQLVGGLSKMGSANAYVGRVNGHRITVIGEVPSATVQRIGQSVYQAAAAD